MWGEGRPLKQWAWRRCPRRRGSRAKSGSAGKRDDFGNKGQRTCSIRTHQSGTRLESWNSGNSEHSQGRNTFPTKTAQDCSQGPGRLCCHQPWRLSNPSWATWSKLQAGSALGRVWTGHLSWFSPELLRKPMNYSIWSISAAAGPFLAKSARVPCHGPLEGQVWWKERTEEQAVVTQELCVTCCVSSVGWEPLCPLQMRLGILLLCTNTWQGAHQTDPTSSSGTLGWQQQSTVYSWNTGKST